ncbi:MAG: 1-phosphofructokinase [Acidobacteria bacterium]|nr:1-phosphofructokinase [Acidobacteriota bacterium]MCB9399351.1 1-phosphofructokinase [Acidobacteriota bacterium]
MIYTITLNPCLDRHLEVEELKFDDANRIQAESRYAAGKGVDVSVVITELGGNSIALGFVGGYAGLELEGMLVNRGVNCDFVQIGEDTRTNIHILNRKTGKQTSLNAKGPHIKAVELGIFCKKIRDLVPKPSFVSMNGSIPQGITPSIYKQLSLWLKAQGARIVLDADGEAFREGLKAEPFLVKPNLHELGRYFEVDLKNAALSELADYCQKLNQAGVEVVVLSIGQRGLLVTQGRLGLHIVVPKVEVRSTIGSGDSVIAGMLFQLSNGSTLEEAARWGAACGTATAMTTGTQLCRRQDVLDLLPKIKVKTL